MITSLLSSIYLPRHWRSAEHYYIPMWISIHGTPSTEHFFIPTWPLPSIELILNVRWSLLRQWHATGDYFIPLLPLPSMALTLTLTLNRSVLHSLYMSGSYYPRHGLPLKNEISAKVSKNKPQPYKDYALTHLVLVVHMAEASYLTGCTYGLIKWQWATQINWKHQECYVVHNSAV